MKCQTKVHGWTNDERLRLIFEHALYARSGFTIDGFGRVNVRVTGSEENTGSADATSAALEIIGLLASKPDDFLEANRERMLELSCKAPSEEIGRKGTQRTQKS